MSTAADLIKTSLRKAGIIASGETPSASEQADALEVLNDILEEWSNDGFMIYEKAIEEFALVGGTQTYSIGTGATFNTERPQLIVGAGIRLSGQTNEVPIELYNLEKWQAVSQKSLQSSFPRGLYYNPAVPSGEIKLWPIPSGTSTLVLYSQKPLATIATAATTLIYPPGYKKALKYNMAAELGPEYGRPVDPKIESMATKTKLGIQRTNTDPVYMISDAFGMNECSPRRWRVFG